MSPRELSIARQYRTRYQALVNDITILQGELYILGDDTSKMSSASLYATDVVNATAYHCFATGRRELVFIVNILDKLIKEHEKDS